MTENIVNTKSFRLFIIPAAMGIKNYDIHFGMDHIWNKQAKENGVNSIKLEFNGFRNYSFGKSQYVSDYNAINQLKSILEQEEIDWIKFISGNWFIDLSLLFRDVSNSNNPRIHSLPPDWVNTIPKNLFTGKAVVQPQVDSKQNDRGDWEASIIFHITEDSFMTKKIFLSHKGADKPIVRHFHTILSEMGFEPWLDEDAMAAGIELERGILQGFKDSCAAIFFVTPNFQDENFLATEVNYAIQQKREKGSRFSIITIVFSQDDKKGVVPELLRQYVWKEPNSDLEALKEIIRALPIEIKSISWR